MEIYFSLEYHSMHKNVLVARACNVSSHYKRTKRECLFSLNTEQSLCVQIWHYLLSSFYHNVSYVLCYTNMSVRALCSLSTYHPTHTHTHTKTMCCVGVRERFVALQLSLTSTRSQTQTHLPHAHVVHLKRPAELCVQNTRKLNPDKSAINIFYTLQNSF